MKPRHIPKSLAAKLSRHGFRVLKNQASARLPAPGHASCRHASVGTRPGAGV
jgi:hypothetical protein